MKRVIIITVAALALFAFKPIDKTTWTLDKAHAKLGFTITHMMVSDVEGWFKTFDATITCSKEDFSDSEVELTAQTKSINTDVEKRDEHLRSSDFFDSEKFPTFIFKSKSFKKVKENTYKIAGDLTMHGITKPVELDAICKTAIHPMTKKSLAGFKISGVIKRKDFDIGGSMPTTVISDEVVLIANAEFVKN